jgi:acetyl esterase/lipase
VDEIEGPLQPLVKETDRETEHRPADLPRAVGPGSGPLAATPGGLADEKDKAHETYCYKAVDGCHIKLDVHGVRRDEVRPVVVSIHGGALIMGDRGGIDRALLGALAGAGFVVVSIDYRLAPEAKPPAIVEEVRDACRWVREQGSGLFRIAPDRLAVMRGSAGGCLTLMTEFQAEPRPKALIPFRGYGDVAGAGGSSRTAAVPRAGRDRPGGLR